MKALGMLLSFLIPTAGVGLPLWAIHLWGIPMPIAIIIILLAVGYTLILLNANFNEYEEDKSIKDLYLERGIVRSISRTSQGFLQFEIEIRNNRHKFNAKDDQARRISENDTVVLAYFGQDREIIDIAAYDDSKPGFITMKVKGYE